MIAIRLFRAATTATGTQRAVVTSTSLIRQQFVDMRTFSSTTPPPSIMNNDQDNAAMTTYLTMQERWAKPTMTTRRDDDGPPRTSVLMELSDRVGALHDIYDTFGSMMFH